jgi:flavin-dependent thymidylate synthase
MFKAHKMARKPAEGASVFLLWATPDPLGAVAAMWRMYKGIPTYALADIPDADRRQAWEDMHKTHLQAPLESIKLHFYIEGVDRAFTHQLVRQRTAVYAQESMRFAVKEDLVSDSTVPPSIIACGDGSQEAVMWEACLHSIEQTYMMLIEKGIPAEDARGLLPTCVATRVHYITDLRNLIDHAGNRLCTQAQFAWRDVFRQIVTAIRDYRPGTYATSPRGSGWQFEAIADSDFFKPVCYRLGHCAFEAVIDRQCVIRSRVQAGKFDEIHDSEWMLDPTAARREDDTPA